MYIKEGSLKRSEARAWATIPRGINNPQTIRITLCCLGSRTVAKTVKSSNFFLKLLHCPEVFSQTRRAMMLGFSAFYSQKVALWGRTWKFSSKFCYSRKMMHICQCHWVKKCCFKCHPDFHQNFSYTTFMFRLIMKKLQELFFWGLSYSIVIH